MSSQAADTHFILSDSRVDTLELFGKKIYIKRDDLLHPIVGGNKARKFYTLINTKNKMYQKIISYGGVQSNAMAALSLICREKGWEFLYFVKQTPSLLKIEPCGNYEYALNNGMQIAELGYEGFYERIAEIKSKTGQKELFIPQGGADPIAEEGVRILADEINSFFYTKESEKKGVVCSSGTGVSAFYLAKHLKSSIKLITTPSVGDKTTLFSQWSRLGRLENEPYIIDTKEKIPFGKPHKKLLETYLQLKGFGVIFDLLYDTKTALALYQNMELFYDYELLFVHSGGTFGNSTQLKRYKYAKEK